MELMSWRGEEENEEGKNAIHTTLNGRRRNLLFHVSAMLDIKEL